MSFKESIIAKRSFEFTLEVIDLTKKLDKNYQNIIIIKHIIRSATSIGANIEEALGSNSRKDFTHCMNIAKKESRETMYWLKLLMALNVKVGTKIQELLNENQQIVNMLTSIVKTTSSKT